MNTPLVVRNLLDAAARNASIEWSDYSEQGRVGAQIYRLYRNPNNGPLAAIVRFLPGARSPAHIHPGYESILVLEGSYKDEEGHYHAGDLVVYPPGSQHSWSSEEGAIMYVVWDSPTVQPDSMKPREE